MSIYFSETSAAIVKQDNLNNSNGLSNLSGTESLNGINGANGSNERINLSGMNGALDVNAAIGVVGAKPNGFNPDNTEMKILNEHLGKPELTPAMPVLNLPELPQGWQMDAPQETLMKLLSKYGTSIFGQHTISFTKKRVENHINPVKKTGGEIGNKTSDDSDSEPKIKSDYELLNVSLSFKQFKEPLESHNAFMKNQFLPIFFTSSPKKVISLHLSLRMQKINEMLNENNGLSISNAELSISNTGLPASETTVLSHEPLQAILGSTINNPKMKWIYSAFAKYCNKLNSSLETIYDLELNLSELIPYWRSRLFKTLVDHGIFTKTEAAYFEEICPKIFTIENAELNANLDHYLQDFIYTIETTPAKKEEIEHIFSRIVEIARTLQALSLGKGKVIDPIRLTDRTIDHTSEYTDNVYDNPNKNTIYFIDTTVVLDLVNRLKHVSLKHAISIFEILSKNLIDIRYYPQFHEAAEQIAFVAYQQVINLQNEISNGNFFGILERVLQADFAKIYRRFNNIYESSVPQNVPPGFDNQSVSQGVLKQDYSAALQTNHRSAFKNFQLTNEKPVKRTFRPIHFSFEIAKNPAKLAEKNQEGLNKVNNLTKITLDSEP